MARATADAGERARLLERTKSQFIRLQDLVRSLLDLSCLEGKTGAAIRQPVDLTHLVTLWQKCMPRAPNWLSSTSNMK